MANIIKEYVTPFTAGEEEKAPEAFRAPEEFEALETLEVLEEPGARLANPAALGLLGLGMTMILLNLHHAMLIELSVVIAAMGFAMGGLAQIIAGVCELKQGNTFGGTVFTAYGLFWWSLLFIWINPDDVMYEADDISMGYYLLLWGVFTLFMNICTLRQNRAMQAVFLTLTIFFFGLAAYYILDIELIGILSGYVGIVCGASAVYTSVGLVLREEFGREILLLCEMKPKGRKNGKSEESDIGYKDETGEKSDKS